MNKYAAFWVVLVMVVVLLGAAALGKVQRGLAAAALQPSEVNTVTTYYVIYVRGCEFEGQGQSYDKTVYSKAPPLVLFPQPGAVDGTLYRYWVERVQPDGINTFFEERPGYNIRAAGIPCAVNWIEEKRELPVRK